MSILSTERLGHSFHDKWLFKDLTFSLHKGDRIALVGINGTGKSTLLKILSGALKPVEGKVVTEKGIRIGVLDQNPDYQEFKTIHDFINANGNKEQKLILEYEKAVSNPDTPTNVLENLINEITESNAWEYESNIQTILNRLQITDFDQEIESLSGGQKKRLALAKLLLEEPDIYILDEPTNHLDIETIEWLENLLTTGNKTILLVSHDRYFLDSICTEIRELDKGSIYNYRGNYAYFLEKKAERLASDQASYEKNKNLWRKELEWMRRQPKARSTKSKSRIDSFNELDDKVKNNTKDQSVKLSVKVSRQGNKIVELENVSIAFANKTIINNFSYVFKKGDKIGLAGKNGSGKSTFLNLLTDNIKPDSGTVSVGETTVYGYYKQGGLEFSESETVLDVVKNIADFITMANGDVLTASQLLTLFLFPPNKQYGLVSKLSGGEKKRLQLMRVLMRNPNVLILDEPTNDLDIDTLNVLEEFLENYPGVLILVSHDRYLIDKLTEQLFIFEGTGEVRIFNGNYADYRIEVEETLKQNKSANKDKISKEVKEVKKKASYKETLEYESLNEEISSIEIQIKEQQTLLDTAKDHNELMKLSQVIEDLNSSLEEKSLRWLELSELVDE